MADMKNQPASELEKYFFRYFQKSVVLEANRLEPRSEPTYVGPDLGSSLFATI